MRHRAIEPRGRPLNFPSNPEEADLPPPLSVVAISRIWQDGLLDSDDECNELIPRGRGMTLNGAVGSVLLHHLTHMLGVLRGPACTAVAAHCRRRNVIASAADGSTLPTTPIANGVRVDGVGMRRDDEQSACHKTTSLRATAGAA